MIISDPHIKLLKDIEVCGYEAGKLNYGERIIQVEF